MSYSMHLLSGSATAGSVEVSKNCFEGLFKGAEWRSLIEASIMDLVRVVQTFLGKPGSASSVYVFERELEQAGREFLRGLVQWVFNHLEGDDTAVLPKHVVFESASYTLIKKKTRQDVWTRFGKISMWRFGYRSTIKGHDLSIFPLAKVLGLIHGATPGLAEEVARLLGEGGMTQSRTMDRLARDFGIHFGVKKLRQLAGAVSEAMAEERHQAQVGRLEQLLIQADRSSGVHKPVIAVGRDGVTLGMRIKLGRLFEVAATGTVTVFDRRGNRLGTVYLAYVPEPGQPTMTRELTRLLKDLMNRWKGPMPRMCYVTDAGENETGYYQKVLKRMKHPVTGKPLEWIRVLDFYHATVRVWTMAELIFGKRIRGTRWARKMLKWLKLPGGINRILHSAAAMRDGYLAKSKRKEFDQAYRYLRTRMAFMKYDQYRKRGIPQGSGITEAACKTVYTQRLKLSGMSWKRDGAQTIINLRVMILSGVWDEAFKGFLLQSVEPKVRGQANSTIRDLQIAA